MSDQDKALIQSVIAGDLPEVKRLVVAGANPQAYDEYPLRVAAQHGHLAILEYLLDSGADPRNIFGEFALSEAAQHGHPHIVKHLLAVGTNVSAHEELPLRMAITSGHADIVRILLDNGAKSYRESQSGRRVQLRHLELATRHGHLEIVQCLMQADTYSLADQAEALQLAVAKGNAPIVQHLLNTGEPCTPIGALLLRSAADSGSIDVLRSLIAAGASRKSLQLVLPDLPPAMQKLVVSSGQPWKIQVDKYARKGVCTEALCILIERQGRADIAAMLSATQMLDPLPPDARADLLGDLLAKQPQPEIAIVGP